MAIVRICAEEVTTLSANFSDALTCPNPENPPVGPGTDAHIAVYNVALNLAAAPPLLCFSYDVEFQYEYMNQGETFMEYCHLNDNSSCLALPDGVTLCHCGLSPTYSYSTDASVTGATPTSVSGTAAINFTVSDLCVPTVFCLDTVACPV